MYTVTKVFKKLREYNPRTIVKNIGHHDLKIKQDTIGNVRVYLYYLLSDLVDELRMNVDREELQREIFG